MLRFRRNGRKKYTEIEPDEIFADSSNIPEFDTDHFEGRVERPLYRGSILSVGVFFSLLMCGYLLQASNLQVLNGTAYAQRAENNKLERTIIFADRGVIEDRTGRMLVSNILTEGNDYSSRRYAPYRGISLVIGYAKPPAKDAKGIYFEDHSRGIDGIEAAYDSLLTGRNGAKLTETDVHGIVVSESAVVLPHNGATLKLTLDAEVSEDLYDAIAARAEGSRFQGGAGVVMDVHSGEIIAMVSYPEFPLQMMSDGTDPETISALLADKRMPFLDRATNGLYAPGSIVKPFVAVGALTEGVIDEHTKILSTGSISVPNPYDPSKPTVFKDWKAHGWVDMRQAIANSSDVYFYEVGGGFQGQKGLGINNLNTYLRMFGFGSRTDLNNFIESEGVIPTPEWKEKNFPGDPWRIGNTYHTSIGQYGVTVTPLQTARAMTAIASNGKLVRPTLIASTTPEAVQLPFAPEHLQVVREGMRMAVTQGTATAVNLPFVRIAAKTGTAQLGTQNQFMNSWILGFFPYENPKYVFAIVLEKAPAGTLMGAPAAANDFFTRLEQYAPEYLQ